MKKSKVVQLALALLLTLSIIALPIKAAFAADNIAQTKTNVTINKRIWSDTTPQDRQNTGEVMQDFGGTPLPGAEFTIYDVTAKYHELIRGSDQKTALAGIQKAAENGVPAFATKLTSQTTDNNGQTKFEDLDIKNTNGQYKVYLFLETKTPDNITVTKKSAPIVLAMPIYKLANNKPTNSLNTDIQLYPKNQTATDKKEFTNVGSFDTLTIGATKFANVATGDTLNYELTVNLPANIGNKAEVQSYKIFDTPTAGLALNGENVKVGELTKDTDYTITFAGGGFTVDLNLDSGKVKALAGQPLVLTYDMKLTAEVKPDDLQNNTASVKINKGPNQQITPPTPVGTGGYKFVKKDAQTGKELSGAEFVVINKDNKFAKFISNKNNNGEYVFESWVTTQAEATKVISDQTGSIRVIGLTNGDYVLNETKAPSDHYVLLADGTIKFTVEHGKYGESHLDVLNTPKGLLPSTGGAGVYGFVIIGLAMMTTAIFWFKKHRKQA
ncbi:SpaH/EbpB family LPXTG-anchored major pilin [Lactococcus lactis]|uniref:SpaH/EbpB family LPXTG-anchored major pilin n=1 Tax=Lactococcus lactis TaxID=1358 RepID=UPI00288FE012|nr:SpaH/EbpB family LPXTG-anchored major pilin [Lactococcus lactis]MDT2904261.1 SpaH/EbpB family LPXTG-anchored major pilin [Lactococcus lactis]